jgi:hypothetical protein
MSNPSDSDARQLMEILIQQRPDATAIEAGSVAARWLSDYVVEDAESPAVRGLPVHLRTELPPTLIVLRDPGGNRLTTIDVTEIDGASAS